jgi:hypothetical protein
MSIEMYSHAGPPTPLETYGRISFLFGVISLFRLHNSFILDSIYLIPTRRLVFRRQEAVSYKGYLHFPVNHFLTPVSFLHFIKSTDRDCRLYTNLILDRTQLEVT